MIKILSIIAFSFMILPAFASTCTPTTYSNGTVISCFSAVTPSQPVQTQQSFPFSSATVKDYFTTLLNKLQSSSQQSGMGNPQFGNVTTQAKKAVIAGIDLFSSVKYLISALFGLVAPMILGYNLPWFAIPVLVWSMIGLTAYFVFKHIWKIVIVSLIIILIILAFLLFGSNFISH